MFPNMGLRTAALATRKQEASAILGRGPFLAPDISPFFIYKQTGRKTYIHDYPSEVAGWYPLATRSEEWNMGVLYGARPSSIYNLSPSEGCKQTRRSIPHCA